MITLEKTTGYSLLYYSLQGVNFEYNPISRGWGHIQAQLTFVDKPNPKLVNTGITCSDTDWSRWKGGPKTDTSLTISHLLEGWQQDIRATVRCLNRVDIPLTVDLLNKLALNVNLCHEA